jgi:hypothetical protein
VLQQHFSGISAWSKAFVQNLQGPTFEMTANLAIEDLADTLTRKAPPWRQ